MPATSHDTQLRGFKAVSHSGKNLPYALKQVMYLLKTVETNPNALKQLSYDACASGLLQRRMRRLCSQILACFVRYCDVESGNVGIPKSKYMDTVTHDTLIREYEKSFGPIHRSRWFRGINALKNAGYLDVEAINIDVTGTKQYLAKAAMKMLTAAFFRDTGVMTREDVQDSLSKAKKKRLKSGLSNCFATYQQIKRTFIEQLHMRQPHRFRNTESELLAVADFQLTPPS